MARRLIPAALAAVVWALPAQASLRVCNNTHMLVNFAIGYNAGERFATEGWWTMTPGSCSTPWRGALPGRYVYLYATDIDDVDVLAGKVSMCVNRTKFKIYGVNDCWRRGLLAVNFVEIDAGGSADWTTFLNDARK
ncbi:MAG TPA: DUF1036 domain-containing protein [Roseiarcus sp.]|nr:DUF1036 domain-containing protein [Roseiarcus sp.]